MSCPHQEAAVRDKDKIQIALSDRGLQVFLQYYLPIGMWKSGKLLFSISSRYLDQTWIQAPRGFQGHCSLVLRCSLGLAARCRSMTSGLLQCSHSTRTGGSWWSTLLHRTETGRFSTVRKKSHVTQHRHISQRGGKKKYLEPQIYVRGIRFVSRCSSRRFTQHQSIFSFYLPSAYFRKL